MKLKTETRTLTPGQTWEYWALQHFGCYSSTGPVEISPDGSGSFSPLIVRNRYFAPSVIGRVIIRNPPTAVGNITVTMTTSETAWDWASGSPQSMSLDNVGPGVVVPVSGPLTDAELRATAVPVSGPLTDAQLRATAVPVSGPLTDAQLRATAVPVSGPLTDAQLRATAVPVSLTSISSSVTPGTAAANLGKARDGAAGGTDTGCAIFFVRRDAPTAVTPAAGDYELAQISASGEQWIADAGAASTHHAISAASTNATSVKASAGTVNHIVVNNLNAAARYLKLYNKASAPNVGTDTPVLTLAIPAGQVISIPMGVRGLRLGTGIAYALTTGIAVADTGAVAASEHAVHISYT